MTKCIFLFDLITIAILTAEKRLMIDILAVKSPICKIKLTNTACMNSDTISTDQLIKFSPSHVLLIFLKIFFIERFAKH